MAKTQIKKLILIFMLIILAFCFCGCASVNVLTITNLDGSIDEIISVKLDVEAILTEGYTLEEIKTDIYVDATNEINTMIATLNNKIEFDLTRTEDEETIDILNSYKNGMELICSNPIWQDNQITIGVRFKDVNVYKYYYNIVENSKIEYRIEEHFFYDKLYYYANTMYVSHGDLYNKLYLKYSLQYPGLINSETTELNYTFVTDSRRQHSDADYIINSNGNYYHTWVIEKGEINKPIMLYYNVANSGNWIILGIGISLTACLIMLSVGLIIAKIKRKKLKNAENIENIN